MRKIISFILAGILAASTYCVSAKVVQDTPTRNYNDIKITIDGNPVITNDATEPFIIDGTTYLPVRALAEALGLNVEWDGTTNTVKLTKPSNAIGAGTILYEENGIKLTYNGIKEKVYEYTPSLNYWYADFVIENNSDKTLTFNSDNETFNGFNCSMFSMYEEILPNRKANIKVNLSYDLEELDMTINELEYISLVFYAIDENYNRIFTTNEMSIILK